MSTIARKFPQFQREAVARLLLPLKIFQISINRLKPVFENLAFEAGSVVEYLEPMLPFFLKELLGKSYSWRDFPYQLLDCDNAQQFCSKYEGTLLPVVLWCGKPDGDGGGGEDNFVDEKLSELSKEVGKDVRRLLVDNFAAVVSFFLATFVAAEKNSGIGSKKQKIRRSKAIYEALEKLLTREKYFQLLSDWMPEILSNILKHVNDVGHLTSCLADNEIVDKDLVDSLLFNSQVRSLR